MDYDDYERRLRRWRQASRAIYDDERDKRAAHNLAQYLGDLLKIMIDFMAKTEPLRNRILADVRALVEALPDRDRGIILSAIAVETQRVFDAAGSPKVGISGGCVGADGVGVTATEGNVTVKGCMIGTLASGPQGGGAEVSVK
jgi:hypothetical protein